MHSDFVMRARSAREMIPVPDVPLAAIRRRSLSAQAKYRIRAIVACGALALGAVGAAAYGEKAYDGIRYWISGGKAAVIVDSLTMTRMPMAADLRAIVSKAPFPVVLPIGLPPGTQVRSIIYAPAERPTWITIMYARPDHHVATFSLIDPSIVNASALPAGAMRPEFKTLLEQWRNGGEIVIGGTHASTWADLGTVKAAMANATPEESLDATAALLPKTVVLGAAYRVDVADRARPATGLSVLLEPLMVESIARNAHYTPIYDNRTYTLTDIPYSNGEPQYERAKISFAKRLLIDAKGVRAVAAVRKSIGDCRCEMLFNQPDQATYWVWAIPMTGPPSATKYSVDARTYAVSRDG